MFSTTPIESSFFSLQVVRDEGVTIGRLVRRVDQDFDSENVVHWIVSFVGDPEEHEVTEKYIGRLVESSETESVKSTQTPPPSTKAAAAKSRTNTNRPRRDKSPPPHKAKSPPPIVKGEVRPSTRSTIKQPVKTQGKQNAVKKAVVKSVKTVKKPPIKVGGGGKQSVENETVVKVKMLTGTLYLYRGDRPRAEFIRTV